MTTITHTTVTLADWETRKAFVGFTLEDSALLGSLQDSAINFVDEVVENLYEQFLRFENLRQLLANEGLVKRLKLTQKQYFTELFSGNYGEDYLRGRQRIGRIHQQVGLEPNWYLGSYNIYYRLVKEHLVKSLKGDSEKANRAIDALSKLITLDESVAIDTYIAAREEIIEAQSKEILELSSPVLKIWDGVLVAPIIGTLDSQRTQLFMECLLETIVETRSPIALIDITGVPVIDTATAQHLIDTISAVKVIGAQVLVTGISPSIAQTLVHLGIDLSGITSKPTLAEGLRVALQILFQQKNAKSQSDGMAL